jgi:hypothetical protein
VAVRTDRLGSGIIATTVKHQVFVVPAGATYLVKTVYGFFGGTAVSAVRMLGQSSGHPEIAIAQAEISPQKAFMWELWAAFDPGTTMSLQNLGNGNLTYWCSGARLEGAAPEAPSTKPT